MSLSAPQEVQQEPCCSALVLCEVYLLRPVCLPDQMWLPKPHPGQLSHQELQLPEPLPLPRVRKWLLECLICLFFKNIFMVMSYNDDLHDFTK